MKIYCDVDNTLIDSDSCIVDLINLRYNTGKTTDDIRDYGYRSIYKFLTDEIVESFFESDDFFKNVRFFDNALEILAEHEIDFCTLGTSANIQKKKAFLSSAIGKNAVMTPVKNHNKATVNMHGAVQIDDIAKNLLHTSAKTKILFRNYKNYTWQNVSPNSGIYVVDTWLEIKQILDFLGECEVD